MRTVALIPAYNEEDTIGDVLDAVMRSGAIDSVIVVSDGSTDRTAAISRARGARVIELESNVGKAGAIEAGLADCAADVVLFLDADLIGLKAEHVKRLVEPVVQGDADMSLGVFEGGRIATDLAQAIAPFLSGQRAMRRELLNSVKDLRDAGYGLEMALTKHMKKTGRRWVKVTLRDVTHRTKEEKLGTVRGIMARVKMYWDIVRFLPRR